MADGEQVARLRQGVAAWNQWRQANPGMTPDLSGITLEGSNFSGVDFGHTNLSGANLGRMHLIGANLESANLTGATLTDATLVDANLNGANISQSKFSACTIIRANLNGANLSGMTSWRAAQFGVAYWDESTIWPEGYTPPSPKRQP
jgi:uncharacterized protein YjbI with pentapeptide repeats